MSKAVALEIVPETTALAASDLASLAADIARAHCEAKAHAELAVLWAIHTGRKCREAKDALPHGQFARWLATACPDLGDRTARRYMALAQAVSLAALPAAGHSTDHLALLLEDNTYREAQAEAIRGITEDRTLTQLYFDFGILKSPAPPAKRQHHPSKLTPEERVEARRARVLQDLYRSLNLIELVGFDEKGFNAMADGDLELYYGLLRDLAERIRTEQLAPRRRDAR